MFTGANHLDCGILAEMLSWYEIRSRATTFAREWADEQKERAEYQSFWNDFFAVFGIRRRSVAVYERKVEKLNDHSGFIDLFWPGTLIAEHKTAGKDLDAAFTQASDYFDRLPEVERPQYIMVTDYARMRLYDLEADDGIATLEFPLTDLPKHVRRFDFVAGYKKRKFKEEDPVNRKAVNAIGDLYRAIRATNYPPDQISPLLTRLVFCFFADDIHIFNPDTFRIYIEEKTRTDGQDLGAAINLFFQVLNTTPEGRQNTMDDDLQSLPYVNGGLFANSLPALFGNTEIRATLLRACAFDWSAVSPAIFGSMFQSVMDTDERHDLGAHYTSEKNILKVLSGLFLDDLKQRLESAKTNEVKLNALWDEVSNITLFDPACGCGNFLVVAYRELRALELEIIKRLHNRRGEYAAQVEGGGQMLIDTGVNPETISRLSIERMYGIEIESFPASIAQLSLWITDHMANMELGDFFGKPFQKLPLRERPHITQGNALTLDWEEIVPKLQLTHILGNPPFIGSKVMSQEQRDEIKTLFDNKRGSGILDYVAGWYIKTAHYIQDTPIRCAFVSTNSITQGEQVGILWRDLTNLGIHINFAHRTFKWSNEAPGKAAVYCVIVGFSLVESDKPHLYEYEDVKGEPHEVEASHINPYLVDAPNLFIGSRSKPISDVPEIGIGNKPIDGGLYLFSTEEKKAFLQREPSAEKYFRPWIGSKEFLHNIERWCLWVGDANPSDLTTMPEVLRRIDAVRTYRLSSTSAPTQKLADTPRRFHVENRPDTSYIVIPETSSELRRYIPMGFVHPITMTSNAMKIVPDATLYHFGVLESEMHMAWMRAVAGRLKSDYRYSKDIVYNNFLWPENPSNEKVQRVEETAQAVLDARAKYPESTLAELYNPDTMPKDLHDAHKALDRAVDACYGRRTFKTEPERLEFLFGQYRELPRE